MPTYKEFENKYKPQFVSSIMKELQMSESDIANLNDKQVEALNAGLKKFTIEQMRREVNEPTKQEFESATPQEQARILSQKSGQPFAESYERVAGAPRSVASELYGGGFAEQMGDRASDYLSGLGRTLKGGVAGLTGGDPLEAMAQTPQTSDNILGSIASDPMTPVGGVMAKAFQSAPFVRGVLGRGTGGGTIQSLLESGEQGELISPSNMMSNLALNIAGEAGGDILGSSGSGLLKQTGTSAGMSSKGAKEALEYAKLKPQRPFTMKDGFQDPLGREGRKELSSVVGTEDEIGEELVDKVLNFDNYLPETKTIRPILEKMPEIDASEFIEAIESVKIKGKMLDPRAKRANEEIDEAVSSFIEQIPTSGTIPASEMYDLRKILDNSINFGKISGKDPIGDLLEKGYKKARTVMKNQLEDTAEKAGFPEYANQMKSLSDKLNIRNKVSRWLGTSKDVADERAEGVVTNLFGKNKSKRQEVMKEFDKITGGDVADKAYKSKLASQIGVEETGIPYSSEVTTGKGGILSQTPLSSPLVQSNVVYPLADLLKGAGKVGLATRLSDQMDGSAKKAIEDYFNTQGEY